MFQFNILSMTFVFLSDEEKKELKKEIYDLVVDGKVNMDSKYWMAWADTFDKGNPAHRFVLYSIAYPQRALLSILD